jgi:hypothetical protein
MLKYGILPTKCVAAPVIPSALPSMRRKPTVPAATLVAANTVLVLKRSKPSRLLFKTNSTANRAPVAGASNAAETPGHQSEQGLVRTHWG